MDRLTPVLFAHSHDAGAENDDPLMEQRVTSHEALSGLVRLLIEGRQKGRSRGYLIQTHTKALDYTSASTSPVYRFLTVACDIHVLGGHGWVTEKTLYPRTPTQKEVFGSFKPSYEMEGLSLATAEKP